MLEKVRYTDPYGGIGVEAFTDGYAYDDYFRIHLLSAAGCESLRSAGVRRLRN